MLSLCRGNLFLFFPCILKFSINKDFYFLDVNFFVVGLRTGWIPCCSDLKATATWEVDGTGSITKLPSSMYLLSGTLFKRFVKYFVSNLSCSVKCQVFSITIFFFSSFCLVDGIFDLPWYFFFLAFSWLESWTKSLPDGQRNYNKLWEQRQWGTGHFHLKAKLYFIPNYFLSFYKCSLSLIVFNLKGWVGCWFCGLVLIWGINTLIRILELSIKFSFLD